MARRRQIYEGKAKILYEGPEPGTIIQYFKDDATAFNAEKKGTINGQIYTTELIGDHTLVTVNWGDDQIVVKAHKDFDGKQGDAVGVVLPPENLYIFDETSGERIR